MMRATPTDPPPKLRDLPPPTAEKKQSSKWSHIASGSSSGAAAAPPAKSLFAMFASPPGAALEAATDAGVRAAAASITQYSPRSLLRVYSSMISKRQLSRPGDEVPPSNGSKGLLFSLVPANKNAAPSARQEQPAARTTGFFPPSAADAPQHEPPGSGPSPPPPDAAVTDAFNWRRPQAVAGGHPFHGEAGLLEGGRLEGSGLDAESPTSFPGRAAGNFGVRQPGREADDWSALRSRAGRSGPSLSAANDGSASFSRGGHQQSLPTSSSGPVPAPPQVASFDGSMLRELLNSAATTNTPTFQQNLMSSVLSNLVSAQNVNGDGGAALNSLFSGIPPRGGVFANDEVADAFSFCNLFKPSSMPAQTGVGSRNNHNQLFSHPLLFGGEDAAPSSAAVPTAHQQQAAAVAAALNPLLCEVGVVAPSLDKRVYRAATTPSSFFGTDSSGHHFNGAPSVNRYGSLQQSPFNYPQPSAMAAAATAQLTSSPFLLPHNTDAAIPLTQDQFLTLKCWYYRDTNDAVQGPFTSYKMREWARSNWFQPSLMMRWGTTNPWLPYRVLFPSSVAAVNAFTYIPSIPTAASAAVVEPPPLASAVGTMFGGNNSQPTMFGAAATMEPTSGLASSGHVSGNSAGGVAAAGTSAFLRPQQQCTSKTMTPPAAVAQPSLQAKNIQAPSPLSAASRRETQLAEASKVEYQPVTAANTAAGSTTEDVNVAKPHSAKWADTASTAAAPAGVNGWSARRQSQSVWKSTLVGRAAGSAGCSVPPDIGSVMEAEARAAAAAAEERIPAAVTSSQKSGSPWKTGSILQQSVAPSPMEDPFAAATATVDTPAAATSGRAAAVKKPEKKKKERKVSLRELFTDGAAPQSALSLGGSAWQKLPTGPAAAADTAAVASNPFDPQTSPATPTVKPSPTLASPEHQQQPRSSSTVEAAEARTSSKVTSAAVGTAAADDALQRSSSAGPQGWTTVRKNNLKPKVIQAGESTTTAGAAVGLVATTTAAKPPQPVISSYYAQFGKAVNNAPPRTTAGFAAGGGNPQGAAQQQQQQTDDTSAEIRALMRRSDIALDDAMLEFLKSLTDESEVVDILRSSFPSNPHINSFVVEFRAIVANPFVAVKKRGGRRPAAIG